jgi:hypothetical protein
MDSVRLKPTSLLLYRLRAVPSESAVLPLLLQILVLRYSQVIMVDKV